MFVTTKQVFCHDKSMLVITNTCLSWESFVATKIYCRDKHNFVVTNILSRQACFCCNKRHVLSWQQLYLWQLPPIIAITILVDANTNLLPYWLMQTPTYCLTGWCKHQLTGLLVDANTNLLPYWLMQTPTYCLTGWCKHQLTALLVDANTNLLAYQTVKLSASLVDSTQLPLFLPPGILVPELILVAERDYTKRRWSYQAI